MVNQAEIHKKTLSGEIVERIEAVKQLSSNSAVLPDKEQAWQDLHRLTQDKHSDVRKLAASALGSAFTHIPDREQAWQDLHRLTQDKHSDVRKHAAGAIGFVFPHIPKKEQAWQDLHWLTQDKHSDVRKRAAAALGIAFPHIPKKEQAWQDLHWLTQDEHSDVRKRAAVALGVASPHTPKKEQAWQDIYRLTQDEHSDVRKRAAVALGFAFSQTTYKGKAWGKFLMRLTQDEHSKEKTWVEFLTRLTEDEHSDVRKFAASVMSSVFSHIPDKEQAWQDLHRLAQDEHSDVRKFAASVMGSVFSHIPDKEQAWQDLTRLAQGEHSDVRKLAASVMGSVFSHIPDKEQAWQDLHRLAQNEHNDVRKHIASALGFVLPHIPDKEQAWQDLHRLAQDEHNDVRKRVASTLGSVLLHIPEKEQAWQDLYRLAQDEARIVRRHAVNALGSTFSLASDIKQVWKDLHRLIKDEDNFVRREATIVLGAAFPIVPERKYALEDLHWLTQDRDSIVRRKAIVALCANFPFVPDQKQAWEDIIRWIQYDERTAWNEEAGAVTIPLIFNSKQIWKVINQLIQSEYRYVRRKAAFALVSSFSHIFDRRQAWEDIVRLTQDEDGSVRSIVAGSIGATFSLAPDRKQAGVDLHGLTQNKNMNVRMGVVCALGSVFPSIPDKKQAWDDLILLTKDKNNYVRASANHSLGKASIYRATEAESEENFRKELEKALEFFEKSLKESTSFNPPRFCFPFYQSFYTITFNKHEAEAEVQNFLAEAKKASEGSENKENLLKAIENLANALKEVNDARDFDIMKRDLNAYRLYCDRAADLLDTTEEKAPRATKMIKRGLPIIDERIKEIIREIQERASAVCKQTQGTPLEEIGQETIRYAQELPLQDPLALIVSLGNMGSIARGLCEYIPADKKIYACEQLKNLVNMELSEQGTVLAGVFEYINKNIRIPRIQPVPISATQQEIVRIAVVQFCFELTESFPFVVKNKDEVKTKIFSALDIAKEDGANIVCLPELCLCEEWINEIKEKYPDMIVIGGSFYKDNKNICPVIMESDVDIPCQPKITPSASEDSGIMESRMIPGDGVNRYETPFGRFVILICRDFDNLVHYFRNMTDIDIIFCPAFNSANERFHKEADVHVEKILSYVLIANTGLYGGTSIFGRLNRNYFSALVDGGCKDAGDLTYKLCEVKKDKEEVIIADFNLIHKSIQVPTPSDPNEEIRSVENIKKIPIQLKQ